LISELRKNYLTDFTKFSGKVAHGLWNKPLDFGGNPGHVTLWLWQVTVDVLYHTRQDCVTVRWGPSNIPQHWVSFSRSLFNSD